MLHEILQDLTNRIEQAMWPVKIYLTRSEIINAQTN